MIRVDESDPVGGKRERGEADNCRENRRDVERETAGNTFPVNANRARPRAPKSCQRVRQKCNSRRSFIRRQSLRCRICCTSSIISSLQNHARTFVTEAGPIHSRCVRYLRYARKRLARFIAPPLPGINATSYFRVFHSIEARTLRNYIGRNVRESTERHKD